MQKVIVLSTLLILSASMTIDLDLSKIPQTSAKRNFLQDIETEKNGYPITFGYCKDQEDFKIQRYNVNPKEITPNKFITLKVHGSALREMTIINLNCKAILNGFTLLDQDNPKEERHLEEGDMYLYTFTIFVPVFVPSGSWEIHFNLQEKELDEKGENKSVSCVLIHFDV